MSTLTYRPSGPAADHIGLAFPAEQIVAGGGQDSAREEDGIEGAGALQYSGVENNHFERRRDIVATRGLRAEG